MQKHLFPRYTILLALTVLFYSLYVAYDVTGSWLGTVKVTQLEGYGGLRVEHLLNLEIWRLFTSQLIHAKQLHGLLNVITLLLLGICLERIIGGVKLFSVWLVAGSLGTLVSTFSVDYPWNIGSGASQANIALAGVGFILLYNKLHTSLMLKAMVAFTLIPAFILDLIYAHYPKPGHLVSLVIGAVFGILFIRGSSKNSSQFFSNNNG